MKTKMKLKKKIMASILAAVLVGGLGITASADSIVSCGTNVYRGAVTNQAYAYKDQITIREKLEIQYIDKAIIQD